jgi:hypothetical protein
LNINYLLNHIDVVNAMVRTLNIIKPINIPNIDSNQTKEQIKWNSKKIK